MPFIRDEDSPFAVAGLVLGAIIVALTLIGQCTPIRAAEPETYTISMGELTAAEHELEAGMFAIGVSPTEGVAIMAPKGSAPWLRLRQLRGRKVEIVVKVQP